MKPEFPDLSLVIFFGVTLFLFLLTIRGLVKGLQLVRHTNYIGVLQMSAVGLLGWLLLLALLSVKGFFKHMDQFPPTIMLTLMVTVAFIVFLSLNKTAGKMLDEMPLTWLIVPQVFRIAVEIVLWQLGEAGICPEQMTWEGRNFDVLAGITAPIAAYAAFGGGRKNYRLALAWNVIGLGLLLNIIGTAILSIPAIGVLTPPNTFIAWFPLVWLPGFVAPYALMLHVMSIRQIRRRMQSDRQQS